jgi:hypothetical protein
MNKHSKTQAYTDKHWCATKLDRGLKLTDTQTTYSQEKDLEAPHHLEARPE